MCVCARALACYTDMITTVADTRAYSPFPSPTPLTSPSTPLPSLLSAVVHTMIQAGLVALISGVVLGLMVFYAKLSESLN